MECALLGDGTSDRILIEPIRWLLIEKFPDTAFNFEFTALKKKGSKKRSLNERICLALELFPCDVLFVHRDVEKEDYATRLNEVVAACAKCGCEIPVYVPVLPCRMTEAWFLISEEAIRNAVGNPYGTVKLDLPLARKLERIPDPKKELLALLQEATELSARRLKKFNPFSAIHHTAQHITDFSPLRVAASFKELETAIGKLSV